MTERKIETHKHPAPSGDGNAAAISRPWFATIDGVRLKDKQGRVRRFSTEGAALAGANRAMGMCS